MRQESISPFQFFSLFINNFIVISPALLANAVTETAKHDFWISLAVGYMLGFLILWALYEFSLRQTNLNAAPATIFGHVALVFYLLYLFVILLVTIRLFVLLIHTYHLPRTPEAVVSLIVLAVACYAAWYGLGSIARISILIFITTFSVLYFFPFPVLKDMSFVHLQPVFAQPVDMIGYGALQALASCLEVFFLYSLIPMVRFRHSGKRYRLLFWSVGLALAQNLFFFSLIFFTFGPFLTEKMVFPNIELFKYFRLGDSFERVEAVMIILWVNAITLRIATLIWLCKEEVGRLFHLRSKNVLLIPLSIIFTFLPFLVIRNISELLTIYHHAWMYIVPAGIVFYLLSRTHKELPSLKNGSDGAGQVKTGHEQHTGSPSQAHPEQEYPPFPP
ncbi:GerAB/ArcD/ProY family transporter [Brevibacillus sp. TJ4]|uniref:GerAB/ArcD/ProY family transporter n=1 Tax=Brevibacillus sp. TJ4 TaxID=3234853 RepID=UPI0037D368C4